jgi:hypothetical protein
LIVKTITQPETQLGQEISQLLDLEAGYSRIVFVSAFTALRTILRLREQLLAHVDTGTRLQLTIGIDLGGTSREVLEELLRWNCETYIFHNTITRTTFHPKLYLFQSTAAAASRPSGVLVWRKTLPRTDALQVREGSHHVGGIRLTQARFENPPGHRIDQTTYFRSLFADYPWESEAGRYRDQEHTFVPMRIIIRGRDYGIHNFEISHKPSGEAGQDNYTTILRWGREFNPIVVQEDLTDAVFSLYETAEENASFLIDITEA